MNIQYWSSILSFTRENHFKVVKTTKKKAFTENDLQVFVINIIPLCLLSVCLLKNKQTIKISSFKVQDMVIITNQI